MYKWFYLSAVIVLADQLSKLLADHFLDYGIPLAVLPFFNLTLLYNPGSAFSFLADAGGWQRWFLLVLAIAISIVLIIWLKNLHAQQRWQALALALILGGAIGNIIDRAVYGHVIDFIQIYYQRWYWPAFNIADSAISVGAVILIIDTFFFTQRSATESVE